MAVLRHLVATSIMLIAVTSLLHASSSTQRHRLLPALETNVGQVRTDDGSSADHVRAIARQGGVTTYLHAGGAHIVIRETTLEGTAPNAPYTETSLRCDMSFLGGNPMARVEMGPVAAGPVRYYLPGLNGVVAEQRASMTIKDVWNNVDVRWISSPQGLKYEFIVRPGGSPSDIAVRFSGATTVRVNDDGGLEIGTPMGTMREPAPVSWRSADDAGASRIGDADVRFNLAGTVLRVDVRAHDKSRTLVIDPTQVWTTYYSGNAAFDDARLAMDRRRNIVLAGTTASDNLPTKVGVVQRNHRNDNGNTDGYITKFDEDGHHLWSTYYGSTMRDGFKDVGVDSTGKIWAVGYTNYKDAPNIFIEEDSVQKFDIMVLKLTADGVWIDSWATGGRENDFATAVDVGGPRVTVVGYTNSPKFAGSFGNPYVKAGTPLPDAFSDAFIARYTPAPTNPDRSNLTWFTFFGGALYDDASSVRSNAAGDIFVCGRTNSPDLPSTQGTYNGGLFDGYVVRFAAAGGIRTWCTYIGGSSSDECTDIAVDNLGVPTVVGTTTSANFPVTAGLGTFSGSVAGTVVNLNPATGARSWSSCVSANAQMLLTGVATDLSRRIWVTGSRALSTTWTTTPDAFQTTPSEAGRSNDGIIVRFAPTGARQYASYLSAPASPGIPPGLPPAGTDIGMDDGVDVLCDADAYMIFANLTTSRNFPTKNAYQDSSQLLSTGLNRNAVIAYFTDCKDSVINITGPSNICDGQPIAIAAPPGFASYQWSTGETSRTITVSDTATVIVACITTQGCRYRDTLKVTKFSSPTVRLGNDVTACKDSITRLTVSITGGTAPFKYKWNRIETGPDFIDADTIATPRVNPTSTSNYEVTVTDANGCIGRDTIRVTVLIPQPTFGTTNLDFGILDPCSSSGDAGVTFRNTMPYPITITSITSPQGTISDITPIGSGLVVPSGGSVDLMLRYTALVVGPTNGVVVARGTPCDWTATMTYQANKARLVATVIPATLGFGQSLSCDAVDKLDTVEIRNGGTDPLIIRPGSVSAPFTIVEPTTDVTVDPGVTIKVVVRYAPVTPGTYNDVVRIPFSAGPCDDTLKVNVTATRLTVAMRVTPQNIVFPTLSGCESDVDTVVTISNLGDVAATITWPTIPEIVLGSRNPVLLQPGQDTTIRVTVRPAALGPFAMNITLTSEPCSIPLRIDVSGTKQGVSFDVPPLVSFGEVSNCGPSTIRTQSSITYSGSAGDGTVFDVITGPSITTTLAKNTTLTSGVPANFEIAWTPTQDGALVDSIVIIFKPCDARRSIRVTGTRTTAAITATNATIDLGNIPVGGTNGVVSFENTGSDTLGLSVASSSADVIITATRPASLGSVLPGTFVEVEYEVPCDRDVSVAASIQATVTSPCPLTTKTDITGTCLQPPPSGTSLIALDTARVKVGDLVTIPIRLLASSGLQAVNATAWVARISYDPLILVGTSGTPDCFTEGMTGRCTIDITGTRGTDTVGQLGSLKFVAVLGYTDTTTISIESFTWITTSSVQVSTLKGRVEILDICRQGGDRYLRYVPPTGMSIHPQPASDIVDVVFTNIDATQADIVVHDVIGNTLVRTQCDIGRDGQTVLDVRSLEAGTYIVTARLGSVVRSTTLVIAR